jgi:hypothetical protein
MVAVIAGGRNFLGNRNHFEWAKKIIEENEIDKIITGDCKGADKFGEMISRLLHISYKAFPADWSKYGLKAGPIRNWQMSIVANICILFPGGKGTESMKKCAIKNNLKIYEYI